MSTVLKHDPEHGVSIVGKSVYYSLASTYWQNLTGAYTSATYHYSPHGSKAWPDGEMATMNMANWGSEGAWYSAKLRLNVALGFGQYEQSIKVGKGAGVCTTFYLSQKDQDKLQEIDFEMSGNCNPGHTPCGTQTVLTCVWWQQKQYLQQFTPLWVGAAPSSMPDTTSGWGDKVYRYKIDWEKDTVTWSVDLTGSGNNYVVIRTQEMKGIGGYDESLCYVFISFWSNYSPDGSAFLSGKDATADCNPSGPCYQAFYFQSLKFTPSADNRLVSLA